MAANSNKPCGCGVSRLTREPLNGDTNEKCHGHTSGVLPHGRRRLRKPSIVLVLWDNFFVTNPTAVTYATQLLNDLMTGSFMNGIAQYGIADGALADIIILDSSNYPAPENWDLFAGADGDQIVSWLNDGTLSPSPVRNESSLLFFLFLPLTTHLTNGQNQDGTPNTNVCGWHGHRKVNSSSNHDDLFWALIRTDHARRSDARLFVNDVAFCASHELVEAFTNRDGGGYFAANGCEIGDLCEPPVAITVNYRGWDVEQYWSNWESACIAGDQPISMRRFLKAIKKNPSLGVRQLETSVINRNFIASKVP